MPITAITNARILTIAGSEAPRREHQLRELGIIERGYIIIEHNRIAEVSSGEGPTKSASTSADDMNIIDAKGRVLMPAFIDCHTHACWAGERFSEFEQKLAGATYLDILNAGGGIMSTVRATRAATQQQLTQQLLIHLHRMETLGTGTVEVKSGYGLDTDTELKMLRAITAAKSRTSLRILPTFLGAHAIDADQPNFVHNTISQTLPVATTEFPGITVDAYCEEGAWSLDDCRNYFEAAQSLGSPIRVHADQFNSLGMTRLAVEMNARSVDHLEAVTPADLEHLARSETMGVMLPVCGFHLDDRYAPGRAFVDAGGALALATNFNPGSAPSPSMPFVIALACRKLGLTPAEGIVATTYNAACVLDLQYEIGSIEAGKFADVQLLDTTDERELAYEIARPGPARMQLTGSVGVSPARNSIGEK